MAEHTIKRRILTKVRKDFLHRRPPPDEDVGHYADLPPTPEQLDEESIRMLEPSLGLVERDRNIQVGHEYLNSHYKVTATVLESTLKSKSVVLSLQTNHVQILPREYCTKRLESYGDLELATWATRLKSYRDDYNKFRSSYYALVNAEDPQVSIAAAKASEQAIMLCKELEMNSSFNKISVFASKDCMVPISLTYNEGILRDMGHNVESFTEWVTENGIPTLFGDDCVMQKELSKFYLSTNQVSLPFFQGGPEFLSELYDKEGAKTMLKIKFFFALLPASEGFIANAYYVVQNLDEEAPSETFKQVKAKDSSEDEVSESRL